MQKATSANIVDQFAAIQISPSISPDDRLATFFDPDQPQSQYSDEDIEEIARLLKRCGHAGHRSPRLYTILRRINHLEYLDSLLHQGLSDGFFPVEARALPAYLDTRVRASIVEFQHLILTKSLDLENGRHCHFGGTTPRPYEVMKIIGHGAYGQVRHIESKVTYKHYALKTIRRQTAFNRSRDALKDFLTEMAIMRRLEHDHVVKYVGSFTDKKDLGVLMSPVAECNLAEYLNRASTQIEEHPTLRTFFGCLAKALTYLHDEEIKHRDIKPQNVLVHKSQVLLTDFGLSHEFLDTTWGDTPFSPRYCAPEVAAREGRNESADIWSLGCVFLEMVAALELRNVEWLKNYYIANGSRSTHYYANPKATERLLQEWKTSLTSVTTRPVSWIIPMLVSCRKSRPRAAQVAEDITAADDATAFGFCCSDCCVSESASEYSSSPSEWEVIEKIKPLVKRSSTIRPSEPAEDLLSKTKQTPPVLVLQATIRAETAIPASTDKEGPVPAKRAASASAEELSSTSVDDPFVKTAEVSSPTIAKYLPPPLASDLSLTSVKIEPTEQANTATAETIKAWVSDVVASNDLSKGPEANLSVKAENILSVKVANALSMRAQSSTPLLNIADSTAKKTTHVPAPKAPDIISALRKVQTTFDFKCGGGGGGGGESRDGG